MERAVIIEGARTPVGNFLGSLSDVPAVDLGVVAAREAMTRARVQPDDVDQLVFGHARQAGNGPNTGRQVAYRSGLPQEVPGFSVNMACGSGVKAVQVAAADIALGNAEIVLAGGMENMTRTPAILDRMRRGYRMGDA
ncbi:MAG TPA: beta-ketoacyl synthase N-terminal-like domain-containing protein, partial [Actinomycetota bacterium]|nr:beta-ketoacyl synthase N-terminal-like domain-containing protein [Actinomycetota bacterium]